MPNTEEQRLDVIENCDILLNTVLKPFEKVDSTPEGRMVAQLHWLKERADKHDLPLPVGKERIATLLRIDLEGWINWTANSRNLVHEEIEVPMSRLVYLTWEGRLLLKPAYYPCAIRSADALIRLLNNPPRPLDHIEQGAIGEVQFLRDRLEQGEIEPPLLKFLPKYPNFRKVHSLAGNSTDDLANGKYLTDTVANAFFNGLRPDTWLTPDDAEREVIAVESALDAA